MFRSHSKTRWKQIAELEKKKLKILAVEENSRTKLSIAYRITTVSQSVQMLVIWKECKKVLLLPYFMSHRLNEITTTLHYCPPGENSWCKFQRDKSLGTSTYKPGPGLPRTVIKHVKPILNELSQESLLRKCLHGKMKVVNIT